MGTAKHIYDRACVPTVAFLLVGQTLVYEVLALFSRSFVPAFLGLSSIFLGAVGVALVLLRQRWSYGRIIFLGALAVLVPFTFGLVAGLVESFQPFAGLLVSLGMILAFGAIAAGFREVIFGPLIIDKSSDALSNKR
jgi:hypothetical protein